MSKVVERRKHLLYLEAKRKQALTQWRLERATICLRSSRYPMAIAYLEGKRDSEWTNHAPG